MFHKVLDSFDHFRRSKVLVVFVACLAVFGDTLLDTVVEPIMPDYLYRLEHPNYTGGIITQHVNPAVSKIKGNIQTTESCKGLVTCLPALYTSKQELLERAKELKKQSTRVGVLYFTKPAVSLIANPVAGFLVDRFGYNLSLYLGIVVVLSSTLAFAFSKTYFALMVARAIQGVGASLSVVAVFVMVSAAFKDKAERTKNVGIVQTGMTFGVTVGPVIGGVMYQFFGYSSPFLLVAGMTLVDGLMRLMLPKEGTSPDEEKGDYSIFNLLKDSYFMLTAALIFIQTATALVIWGIAPVWMMITMNAQPWQQGLGLLPYCLGFLIGAFTASKLAKKAECWMVTLFGFTAMGIFTIILPLCRNIPQMIAPYFFLGVARGITDTTLIAEIGHLADIRHGSRYGRAYAISETSVALGIAVGLGTSGVMLNALGFTWMMRTVGILNIIVSLAAILLRNPPSRPDNDKHTQSIIITSQPKLETRDHEIQPGVHW